MEDFAYGVDREQLTDAALRVARRTGARLQELDEKVGLTKTVTSGVHAITAKVNSRTAPVLEKVQQNETVQAVTDATVAAAATVNAKLSEGFSWVHAKLNPPAKVNAPEILTRPAAGGGGVETHLPRMERMERRRRRRRRNRRRRPSRRPHPRRPRRRNPPRKTRHEGVCRCLSSKTTIPSSILGIKTLFIFLAVVQ